MRGEPLLRGLALGNIPDVGRERPNAIHLEGSDRELDGKLCAVRTAATNFYPAIENGAGAGCQEVGQAPAMRLPESRRDDEIGQRLAEHFCPAKAKYSFGSRIELGNASLAVHEDDGVQRSLQNRGLPRVPFPLGLTRPAFGPSEFGQPGPERLELGTELFVGLRVAVHQ